MRQANPEGEWDFEYPESQAREDIDHMLERAGWSVRIRGERLDLVLTNPPFGKKRATR